jgi:CRISPR/Cas system type I-B associated protein Csh2 (Cas7 group RAMP superfamily)
MDPEKLKLAKTIIGWSASFSVSKIVADIVRNNTVQETLGDKAKIVLGVYVLNGMMHQPIRNHTDQQVDDAIELFYKLKKAFQGDQSSTPETKGP